MDSETTSPAAADRRIVIFTSTHHAPSTVEAIEAIARAMPHATFLVLTGERRWTRRTWLRSKRRRLLREPISYPVELICQALSRLRRDRGTVVGMVEPPSIDRIAAPNVHVDHVGNIHGRDAHDALRVFRPWLGVSIGAPILRESLFSLPELGTINLHKSLLPEYRGMPSGFWELHDGATTTGASVHWMARKLDAGPIVHQRSLEIPAYATPGGLSAMLDELGETVLLEALQAIDAGAEQARVQGEAATPIRSRPSFFVADRVRARCAARRRRHRGFVAAARALVKAVVLFAYVHVHAPLRNLRNRLRGRCHTTVLLYHRVNDGFIDSVTVGIEQFQDHLRLLRKHYDVVDLRTFLATRGAAKRRPQVVLTFDDGYADNHLAARLLRREGLPCTFFVCTGIVGEDKRAFPHDMKKLRRKVPALAWNQVGEMSHWGFDLGNHTEDHVDVGAVPTDEALEQIRGASDALIERIGNTGAERWFAFPYGRPKNITEDLRAALGASDIDTCLSAYGGTNPTDFDPLDVRRQGIDSNFSKLAFRAVVEGWRVD